MMAQTGRFILGRPVAFAGGRDRQYLRQLARCHHCGRVPVRGAVSRRSRTARRGNGCS